MKKQKLVISDVDFTLLGDDRSLSDFARWYDEHQSRVQLVLTSGRFCRSVAESVQQTLLPDPAIIIGGVGTQLEMYPSRRPIRAWDLYRPDSGWDGERVRKTLRQFERLEPQADEFQSEFKISYFLRIASAAELESILSVLRDEGIDAELIYSSRRDLDVLPAGCNKGTAAEFVADYLGYEPGDVIVCGDSANDLHMFTFGFPGIVVGNAHPELLVLDDPLVYKSTHDFAAGVLDGLDYWLRRDGRRKIRELANASGSSK